MIESLEDRRLLNVDWRNPVDSIDVDNDGVVSPLDALVDINYINSTGSGALPARRDPTLPFLDVDGDQSVSPLDVLNIINHLNANGSGQRSLSELAGQLVDETDVTITLGQFAGTRNYRVRIDTQFDTTDPSAALEDLLAVYLVDPMHPTTTLLDRGTNGTALFTLAGTKAEFIPGRVRWDGSVLDIDLSDLATSETGMLKFQLLNSDSDSQTKIGIVPLTNRMDIEGTVGPMFPRDSSPNAAGPALTLANLAPVASSKLQVSSVRFDSSTGKYIAEVSLSNEGDALGREVAVVFPGLPEGVTLRNRSGTTAAGEPYLNLKPAIQRGGLRRNARSEPVIIEFDNPGRLPIILKPRILANVNHAPTLAPIAPLTVMPGGILSVALDAIDQDGDPLSFSLVTTSGTVSLPTGTVGSSGVVTFRPTPSQVGVFQFDVIASDGALAATRSVTLNVVADPITTTRVSGRVLKVNGQPLASMPVQIGAVQGLTLADGSFTLDLGSGTVVSDTIKVRGELFGGPLAYPFIAEKLQYMLKHVVYARTNNMIDRPIYLPALDVAGGTTIDPMRDMAVRQTIAPGETAEVFVAAGTLINLQGTPFTGTLSITEVPIDLTPAALPDGLSPGLVVTIQPGDMVFARPAPLSLPNREGYPAGKILDLWSINPVTGEFDDVGDMQVSPDGKSIETISGGIRNSSWHFVVPPPIVSPKRAERYNPKQGCPACEVEQPTTSTVNLHSGTLTEMHDLVTYQSQGQQRGVQLIYDSMRADPRPIVHFGIDEIDVMEFFPFDVSRVRFSAYLAVARDEFSMVVPGANRGDRESVSGGFAIRHYSGYPDDSHFWKLPEGRGSADGALQIDLRDQPTGAYQYALSTGVGFYGSGGGGTVATLRFIGSSSRLVNDLLVVNSIASPFGAGWGIAGLQQIVEGKDRRKFVDGKDRTAMIVDGGGTELLFQFDSSKNKFISPPGDFSILEQLNDGTYRRTTPDKTVYQFNSQLQLATMTDRNQNATTYGYDANGKLISITDPVGLVTTFTYNNNRVATITDPVGRQTTLTHDSVGNLTRVIDPDDSSRTWRYDSDRHMTGETDKLGRTEESTYGFHGRVTSALRKDGSRVLVNVPQVQGLLLPDATSDFRNSPRMARLTTDALATYVDGNGNAERTNLDGAGQSLGEIDAVGANPVVTRDKNNLPASRTNARGFTTSSTFDDRGNVLTTRDVLSVRIGDEPGQIGLMTGTIRYNGEMAHYSFQGKKGEELYIDAIQGRNGFVVRQPSGERLDSLSLPVDGTYQVDVGGLGPEDYTALLLSVQQSPTLPLNTRVVAQAPAGQDFIYRVSLLRHQRLRIEDHVPSTSRNWYARRLDENPYQNQRPYLSLNAGREPGVFEGTAPADGEYLIFAANGVKNDMTLVPFSFTATVTDPAPVAKTGMGVVRTGTVQPGEEQSFSFSGKRGDLVYFDLLSGHGFPELTVRDSSNITLAHVDPLLYRLPDSGTFQLVAKGRVGDLGNDRAANFAFRIVDLAAVTPAAFGNTITGTVTDGAAQIYRLPGTAGQRFIAQATFDDPLGVSLLSEAIEGTSYGFNFFNKDALLALADTGDYFVIVDGDAAAQSFSWRTFDSRLALPISLDQDLRGTFTVGNTRKYYRFTDTTPSPVYVERLDFTEVKIFDEFGSSPISTPDGIAHEYILLAMEDPDSIYLPLDFAFRLHDFHTSESAIKIGQTVTGKLDVLERDSFTFEGTAGQVLYFDDLGFDANVDRFMELKASGPGGRGLFGTSGRGTDFGPFTLTENGTYRIDIELGSYNRSQHRDYQFRLFDLREAPFASLNSPLIRPLSNGASVAAYQFAAAAGQRVSFSQNTPTNTTLRVYSSLEKLLLNTENNATAFLTFSDSGTYYVVVSARDQSDTLAVASQWTIFDAAEPPVVPSGFGDLRQGTAREGDLVATFHGNAGTRVLLQQGDFAANNRSELLSVQGPSGETVAISRYLFRGSQIIFLPRSGAYTVRLFGAGLPINNPKPYKFVLSQLQDLPLLAPGSIQPISSDDLGTHFRIQGTAGQQLFIDTILPDNVDGRLSQSIAASVLDPVTVTTNYSSPVTIPRSGNYVLGADLINTPTGAVRTLDVAAAPRLALDTQATGTLNQVYEDVLLRFSAAAGEKRLFQFDYQYWQLHNLTNPQNYNSLSLASTEISPGNIVWQGVANFTLTGEYALIRVGRFNLPLNWSALMSPFVDEPLQPLIGGTLSHTEFAYEAAFNQVSSLTDEQGRRTRFDIDPANGNMRSITKIVGQPGGVDDLFATFTYLVSGQIDTATDPLGRVTDYDYDAQGRVITLTSAKGTPQQTVRRSEYDAAGNVATTIDENGNRTGLEYDTLNRLTRITEPDPDGAGPLASPVTQVTYDAAGNLLVVTDAAGQVSRKTYDSMNRPSSMTDPGNNKTSYFYDQAGNVIRVTDPLGQVSRMRYDARNRLVASVDPAGFETRFQYDADNNLISLTDASGNVTRYTYDARGRTVTETDPLGNVTTYSYNGVNEMVAQTDRLGRRTRLEYDDVGRLTRERWVDAQNTQVNTVNYTYDAASRLVRVQDGVSDLQATFDVLDRTTRVQSGGVNGAPTTILDYSYDAVGNVISTTDTINGAAGGTNAYVYDALDRLTRLTQTSAVGAVNPVAAKRVDLGYNSLSQFTTLARFADLAGAQSVASTSYSYDALNRLTDITHRNPTSAVLDSFAYQYDAASRITRITDIDGATDFQYDTRDQLTAAAHSDPTNVDESYAYDGTGNRLSSQRHGSSYVVGDGVAGTTDNNRLTSDGTYRYAYDAEGNLLTRTQIAGGAVRDFAWDHRNRLIRVTDRPSVGGQPTQLVEYTYDALNRRIAKKVDTTPADAVDGAITYFVYDGSDVLAELTDPDGSGPAQATESMRYLHGPAVDQVLAQEDALGDVEWILADHLGTIRDLVNNSGQIIDHLKYDSYGNVVSVTNPTVSTRYRFTGREFDAEIGLQYNRARYYDAAIGRFIGEDPIGFKGDDSNLYRYVGNQPVVFIDPPGLAAVGVMVGTGATAGFAMGGKVERSFGYGLFGGNGDGSGFRPFAQDTEAHTQGSYSVGRDDEGKYHSVQTPENAQQYFGLGAAIQVVSASIFLTNATSECEQGQTDSNIAFDLMLGYGLHGQIGWGNGVVVIQFGVAAGIGADWSYTSNAKTFTK